MVTEWLQNFSATKSHVTSPVPVVVITVHSPEKPDGFPKSIPLLLTTIVLGMVDISPIQNISKTDDFGNGWASLPRRAQRAERCSRIREFPHKDCGGV